MQPLFFQPIYMERVWGGRGLETKLGRTLPGGRPIGESWEIVDRPEACSIIAGGEFDGLSLRKAIEQAGDRIMGSGYDASKPFPILVKWLDCQQRLSLQVHPPATIAPILGGEPKTENWYIADCEPDAALLAGLKAGVTRRQFETALAENALEPLVHRIPSAPGDSLFVYSGRIHAIDAGNLILEIQQNSDTTYRVYDWGRTGLDGQPRQLHVEQSLKSIDFNDFEPESLRAAKGERILADCVEFHLHKYDLKPGAAPLHFAAGEQPRILSVAQGVVADDATGLELRRGDNVLLPCAGEFSFTAPENATLLITSDFC